ncbi:SafA/ExsA family spore coat assembly protein [Aquibacillus saliphilus]|uniref:SafA/ExsA family spore coat assembly protein n=1 Tax=Aquibacillus saliphilus TaxID=1909422 RepID=UPI001CF09A8F|nr:SafA/ExsA family spore coat assembly protein [Aquibacillus saliphilus]
MKIHVVQKGETLWSISQKYGVDFEEVKKMNTQISNPDMIMPGMKIRVPTSSKEVKKEKPLDKQMKKYPSKEKEEKKKQPLKEDKEDFKKQETKDKVESKKQPIKHSFKDSAKKTMPVIKEDDYKKTVKEKEGLPMYPKDIPKMPKMEKDMWKAKTKDKGDMPQVPQYNETVHDYHQQMQQPMHEQPMYQPMYQQPMHQQPMYQPMHQQPMHHAPVMPMNQYQPMPHCVPMNPVPYPVQQMPVANPHHQMVENVNWGQNMNDYPNIAAPYPNLPNNDELMESSSGDMDMPEMPQHLPGVYEENPMNNFNPAYGQPQYMPNQQTYPGYQPDMQQYPYSYQPTQSVPYSQQPNPANYNHPTQQMGYQAPQGDNGYHQQSVYPTMPPVGQGFPGPPTGGYGYQQPNPGAPGFDTPYNPGYRLDEDEDESE